MIRELFDSLGELNRFDDLEALLDYAADQIVELSGFDTALITFYLGKDAFYGARGVPPGTKERFRKSFHLTSDGRRRRKREVMLGFGRPGTNICFIPEGAGPRVTTAYVPGWESHGSWRSADRLIVFMRNWENGILGMCSLDNPRSGNRPDEEGFRRLEAIDSYVNVAAKLAENRFWSLRLAESEAAYRSVFEASTDGLVIFSRDGKIVLENEAALRLHGHKRGENIGRDAREIVHPDAQDQFETFVEKVGAGQPFHVETFGARRDGTKIELEVHGAALMYQGRPHLLAVIRDITERKRMFERLLEQQKDESIVAVAGGVAHDFNNILLGIMGSAALMHKRLPKDSDAIHLCERVMASSERLSSLTGQLLAVARGVHSEPRPLTLRQIIADNRILLEGMIGSRVEVEFAVDDDGWIVHADQVQLGQVLLNLTQNACEAMDRGGKLVVRCENASVEQDWTSERTGHHPAGDYVRLVVEDDGHGMDQATLHHIFDPYFSTKDTGSGLGLAAVLGIVRRHGGAIRIDSRPGEGTRIEVLLPRDLTVRRTTKEPAPQPSVALGRRRILLVDDDRSVRMVLAEMLDDIGCEVVQAADGTEGVRIHGEDTRGFDLVLLDVEMPGLTGVEAGRAILEEAPDARILLTSGHTDQPVRDNLERGTRFAGFLQKPYDLRGLRRAITKALDGKGDD